MKIRIYGLVSMTRNAYLTLQVVLAVAVVVLLVAIRPILAAPGHRFHFVNEYFVPIIVAMLALECIETAVMLSKFKKAERERSR